MSEMVERVARVTDRYRSYPSSDHWYVYDMVAFENMLDVAPLPITTCDPPPAFEIQFSSHDEAYNFARTHNARAAILAMREPTEAMILAGEHAEELGDTPPYKHWCAMIDEALKE